ncbi:MAG: elongation factor P [Armatimonadia bacterium]|nr:elongation factor P [Armatimonadia bacterium]
MITTADFKNGISIVVNGQVFQIVEFQHVKPGKGRTFVRTRLRNIKTGQVIDKTFTAGESVEDAFVERRPAQYVYRTGDEWVFMDLESYDQFELGEDMVGDQSEWLVEGMEVSITHHDGTPIGMEVPEHVEMEVTSAEPGVKGDTAQGGTKPVTLESGAVVQAPLFIEVGDRLKVDTGSKKYIERLKK